jgi:hypothetical protein
LTDADLFAAIQANPTALSQANAGNDAGCAATLSAGLPPVLAPLSSALLNVWGSSRGVLVKINAGMANANAQIASACIGVNLALQGGASTLDLTNPVISGSGGLLDGLTEAGILPTNTDTTGVAPTPGSKADLLAFGSVPQTIDTGQVSRVWLQFRPGGIVGGQS